MKVLTIDANPIGITGFDEIMGGKVTLQLSNEAKREIKKCRDYLDNKLDRSNNIFYGINTGFGDLCNVSIPKHEIEQLQSNLVLSHACGMGDEVRPEIVRLMLFLKIRMFAQGHSGISLEVVERLVTFYNEDILPTIYELGSLGASGDLAPLAHLSLPILGQGEIKVKGVDRSIDETLTAHGIAPLKLKAKEGLALLNGTQFMSAHGCYILSRMERLQEISDIIAALSIDAFNAKLEPFHKNIHNVRQQPGQIDSAEQIRTLLKGSQIIQQTKKQVQDPYSFRCIPQVHGAVRDAIAHVQWIFENEINGVTDNPNIFADEDLILSGGNFHGQPLAMALDYLAIALAELGSISERRVYKMLSGERGLPPFLVKNPGLNSGLMIAQYSAASIVSQNKQLCTPASVDTIDSSNGQEDHVSMGANAATKCLRVMDNLERLMAIELLASSQALEYRRPLHSSNTVEGFVAAFRNVVPTINEDRPYFIDFKKTIDFIYQVEL